MKFTPGEINIVCTDVEVTRQFYVDILGFSEIQDNEGYYHLICGDRQYLLLPDAKAKGASTFYGDHAVISMDLNVDDLEEAYNYLKLKGVVFESHYTPDKEYFVIRDPDGLFWEIVA